MHILASQIGPASVPTPATSPPPAESAVDRAELGGAHFEERKRFHFPWTSPTRPLKADQVTEKLAKGRVQARTPESPEPLPMTRMEDVEALANLQTDADDRARAVHALAEQDWKFHDGLGAEVGAYQAYNGKARACRDGLAVPMDDPVAVWSFYDPAHADTAAELERKGYRFYERGQTVAGPYASPQARLGKGEGWLRPEELSPGHELEQLQRFESLRELAQTPDQVRAGWDAEPGDMDRLLGQGVPIRLALKVGAPPDEQLWKELATLPAEAGLEALRHMAPRSDEARLALALATAAPRHQGELLKHFSHSPPDAEHPETLQAIARNLGQEGPPLNQALLGHMLTRPTQTDALAHQASLVTDFKAQQAALRTLAGRPECAGLQAFQERWLPSLQKPESRQALVGYLLKQPRLADDPAVRADLARQLQGELRDPGDKGVVARLAFAEALAANAPVDELARQGQNLARQGQDVRPALEALKSRPECAGLKTCLETWGPVLKDQQGSLHGLLLSNPRVKNDLASRQSLAEEFLATNRYSLSQDVRRRFAEKVQDEVVASSSDMGLLARQGLAVLGQGGDAGKTLKALGGLPGCSGLENLYHDWQPALSSEPARTALARLLLANPTVADDPATRQAQCEALLQQMRYEVADPIRRKFAETVQDELLACSPDVKLLARQGLVVLQQGGSAGKTVEVLAARPECAGLKAYRDSWGRALKTPEGIRALHSHLLSHPDLKADVTTRLAQAEAFLTANRYNLAANLRTAFAETVQDDVLASGGDPAQIARAGLMVVELGGSALKSVEALAARPECAGLMTCLQKWGPALKTPEAMRELSRQLLSHPRQADDLATRMEQARGFLDATRYSLPSSVRSAFAEKVQDDVIVSGGTASQIAVTGQMVVELGGSARKSLEALAALPECALLKACLRDWAPTFRTPEATRELHKQLLSDPHLPDGMESRAAQAGRLLQATRYSLPTETRRAFAMKALDEQVAGLGDPDTIGRLARTVMDLGGPVETALEALAARSECEGLRDLRLEWRWDGMSREARRAVDSALLSAPGTKATDEDWKRLGATVQAGLPAAERPRFAAILEQGPVRRELERMLQPEVSTGIDEQADALVVGGVVVKKRQAPEG